MLLDPVFPILSKVSGFWTFILDLKTCMVHHQTAGVLNCEWCIWQGSSSSKHYPVSSKGVFGKVFHMQHHSQSTHCCANILICRTRFDPFVYLDIFIPCLLYLIILAAVFHVVAVVFVVVVVACLWLVAHCARLRFSLHAVILNECWEPLSWKSLVKT